MPKFLAAKYLLIKDVEEEREWRLNHNARMIQIGNLMRITRIWRKVSLRELAHRLSISAAYLSDMERGNRMYSLMYQKAAMKAMRREKSTTQG